MPAFLFDVVTRPRWGTPVLKRMVVGSRGSSVGGRATGDPRWSPVAAPRLFTARSSSRGSSHPPYFSPLASALDALGRVCGAQP